MSFLMKIIKKFFEVASSTTLNKKKPQNVSNDRLPHSFRMSTIHHLNCIIHKQLSSQPCIELVIKTCPYASAWKQFARRGEKLSKNISSHIYCNRLTTSLKLLFKYHLLIVKWLIFNLFFLPIIAHKNISSMSCEWKHWNDE